jgi:GT2 family glycosyltransferase/glycosyltransferase involved in cell wall biosynthesis
VLRPNPLFDATWYLGAYPDVRESGSDPYRHYVRHGWQEGRDPNAFFQTDWYLNRYPGARSSRHNPLDHYLRVGAGRGYDPSPLFDGSWYLEQNPDVRAAGWNPLLHYLRHGAAEGREPRLGPPPPVVLPVAPTMDAAESEEGDLLVRVGRWLRRPTDPRLRPMRTRDPQKLLALYFDRGWYAARYADRLAPGEDPFAHYMSVGARQGLEPNRAFHAAGYVYDNPDVDEFDGNPLLHYARVGRIRGAAPHPLFEAAFYGRRQAAVHRGGVDPYAHYLHVGLPAGEPGSPAMDEGSRPEDPVPRLTRGDPERVTVIVPAYGNFALTYRCLYALAHRTPPELLTRTILADDRPEHPVAPLLSGFAGLEVRVNGQNLGFLRSCNAASMEARGEYVVFLNNDAIVLPGWLGPMVETAAADPRVGMVGGMILAPDGRIQSAGEVIGEDGWSSAHGEGGRPDDPGCTFVRDVDALLGACLLVRRSAFELAGRFDERYAPAFYEEFELAFTLAERGYRVVFQPASRVLHYGGASYGRAMRNQLSSRNHDTFMARWGSMLRAGKRPGDGPAGPSPGRPGTHPSGTILVVDDSLPEYDRSTGGNAIFQLLELLLEEGLRVIFMPHDGALREPYTGRLEQMGVQLLDRRIRPERALRSIGPQLDWIICARPAVAAARLPLLRRTSRARILYFTHDLHFLREERHFTLVGRPEIQARSEHLRRLEQRIFRSVDGVLTLSPAEAGIIAEMAPGQGVFTIPPLVFPRDESTSTVAAHGLGDRHEVIFVAGFRHLPNVDAATFLIREIMPTVWSSVPATHVLLVGSHPPPAVAELAGDRVTVTGHVADLGPYYRRARLSVSPLRFGAGVKGKILESLHEGVPVVTTSVGNEGIDLRDGVEAMIADDAAGLAERIVALLGDPRLADRLAAAGRAAIEERFSWQRARDALLGALGLDLCRVCGRRCRIAPAPPGPAAQPCEVCGADARQRALADAALNPYWQYRCPSLAEAAFYLGRLAPPPDVRSSKARS